MTFATPRRSKKMKLGEVMIEFHQLRADPFFGYILEKGLYLAEPEKALLDELYLLKRGRASIALDELRYDGLSMDKIEKYASRFPSYVQNVVAEIVNLQKARMKDKVKRLRGKEKLRDFKL